MRLFLVCAALVVAAPATFARPDAAPREIRHTATLSYYKYGVHKFPGAYEVAVKWDMRLGSWLAGQVKWANEYVVTVAWQGPATDAIEMKVVGKKVTFVKKPGKAGPKQNNLRIFALPKDFTYEMAPEPKAKPEK